MSEQPTATFEGLLRRYSAFREIGDERLKCEKRLPCPAISLHGWPRVASGQIACPRCVFALWKAAVASSTMILVCVGQ